jgi:hypothetical protein
LKIIVEINELPIVLKNYELKSPRLPLLNPNVGKGYSDKSAFTSNNKNAVLKN